MMTVLFFVPTFFPDCFSTLVAPARRGRLALPFWRITGMGRSPPSRVLVPVLVACGSAGVAGIGHADAATVRKHLHRLDFSGKRIGDG